MAKHSLSLDIPTTLNECILPVMDTSIYADKVPVECAYLDVVPPGFNYAARIEVEQNFCLINLTACDLQIQTRGCDVVYDTIPDGVYVIKYSVAPNEYVFVEYNHLRITNALKKLEKVLCAIDVATCDPLPETKEKLEEVRLIEMLLKAAKSKVEFCHKPGQGMDLYEYALKRLNKLDCTICI